MACKIKSTSRSRDLKTQAQKKSRRTEEFAPFVKPARRDDLVSQNIKIFVKEKLGNNGPLVTMDLNATFPARVPSVGNFKAFLIKLPQEKRKLLTEFLMTLHRLTEPGRNDGMSPVLLASIALEPFLFGGAESVQPQEAHHLRLHILATMIGMAPQLIEPEVIPAAARRLDSL